jgi:AAA domain/DnaB-like helicase N terminal domain
MRPLTIQSIPKPSSCGTLVEGHEALLVACFLNDEAAILRYTDLKPEHFGSPINREIFTAILQLRYDGHDTNFLALEDYFRRRGRLREIGAHTLSTLAGDSRITAMDNACCDYAKDCVLDAYREREAARIFKDGAAGQISAAEARERLKQILTEPSTNPKRPLIEFRSPRQLKNFTPPPGLVLVGDCHIVRGSVFVIGGTPGVGKSRASVALAVAGATRSDWFGLKIHRSFKVMIIQTENGEFRLSKEFRELDCDTLEDYIRVCPPPPHGLCFQRDEFRAQLAAAIVEFKPDIVICDPWNAAARDEKAREYLETFDALRSVLPLGDDAPALGIVAHTRKPKTDERASGRALLNLLAGSYVLGSVPRSVFVMQAASEDTTDNRVVWTCCKNNDGELGECSAWERRNGLFSPVLDFDWEAFDNPHPDNRVTITADHMAEIFENGEKRLIKADAVRALQTLTEAGRTACYNALRLDGRFAAHLSENHSLLSWKGQQFCPDLSAAARDRYGT